MSQLKKILDFKIPGIDYTNLKSLDQGANYFGARYLNPITSICIYGAVLVVPFFVTYMLYVLYKENRLGWVMAYFLLVSPAAAVHFLFINNDSMNFATLALVVGLSFFYFVFLRFQVHSWDEEEKAKAALFEKKKRKEFEENTYWGGR